MNMRTPHIRFSVAWILALWVSPSFHSALATFALNQAESPVASAQVQRGIDLYRQHKYADAAIALKRAVKEDKTDADGWYYLGLALIQDLKQLKDASKAFETAAKIRPNFAAAHTGLAYTLLLRDKTNDAAREAQLALKIEPTIADAYYIFGVTRLRAGAKEEALQNADAAIKLQPRLAPAYLLKSEALVSFFGDVLISEGGEPSETRKNRYREAADALQKFLDLSPDANDKKTWSEQLESLRFYVNDIQADDSKLVYSGKEVDTIARVVSKPEPVYTELARAKGTIGTVILRCVFTSDGNVKHLLIIRPLPFGLTEQAIKAAGRIKFIPAMKDGRSVSMYIQLEYIFNLY
jgi:TonB family protein